MKGIKEVVDIGGTCQSFVQDYIPFDWKKNFPISYSAQAKVLAGYDNDNTVILMKAILMLTQEGYSIDIDYNDVKVSW